MANEKCSRGVQNCAISVDGSTEYWPTSRTAGEHLPPLTYSSIYQALTTFRRTSAASILGRFFKKRNVYIICCTDVMPLISIVKATSATHGTRDDRGAVHSRKECRAAGAARPEKETLVAFSGECQKLCSCAALEPCSFACSILFAVHTNLNC